MAEPVGFVHEGPALQSALTGRSHHPPEKQPFCQQCIALE